MIEKLFTQLIQGFANGKIGEVHLRCNAVCPTDTDLENCDW